MVIQGHEQVTDKRRLLGVGRIEQDERKTGRRHQGMAFGGFEDVAGDDAHTRGLQTERGEVLLEDGTSRAIALDEGAARSTARECLDAERPTTREGVEHDDVGQVWQT